MIDGEFAQGGTATTPWQWSDETSDVRLRKSGTCPGSASPPSLPANKFACTLATTPSFHSPFPTQQLAQPQPPPISIVHTRHTALHSLTKPTPLSVCTRSLTRQPCDSSAECRQTTSTRATPAAAPRSQPPSRRLQAATASSRHALSTTGHAQRELPRTCVVPRAPRSTPQPSPPPQTRSSRPTTASDKFCFLM